MAERHPHLGGYQAAHEGAAYFPEEAGYILVSGEDRKDFIQRQTTNDIHRLSDERALLTVLTSPNARILDVFYLVTDPQGIGLITLPGTGAQTASFLNSRIFFNDQVRVEDLTESYFQIDLLGPKAGEIVRRISGKSALETDEIASAQIGEGNKLHTVQILAMNPAYRLGYRVLAPREAAEQIEDIFLDAGAEMLDPASYLTLRIESGFPEAGYELVDEYTPLEVGLQFAISDSKGCYTGQEVIARQITYDKVTQRLVGLRLQAEADYTGEKVWAEDRPVGTVTSMVVSPRYGPIALAVIKRPYNEPGTKLTVGTDADQQTAATVEGLPFS